ncbi:MAG: bifunctional phosphoserine phosphatase/homoserine phosphotransferase ThrH [Planctomycetota bacterium]|nr:MAG: bifunctional phosphoserine phosphatase/homoserine phosphotransferase ThrH [Planctomycetota bacterium]
MLACLDLEGVLIPEIWINVAEKTGIEKLKITTRDISDYDELMTMRLEILKENNIKLKDIQDVISTLSPMEGAVEFLNWLKGEYQVIILSDTFYQFAHPLMKQLNFPTLFCHNLTIDSSDNITNYVLRLDNHKQKAVEKFHELNFKVAATGDSYNDVNMLKTADYAVFYKPPESIIKEFSDFEFANNYDELKKCFESFLNNE